MEIIPDDIVVEIFSFTTIYEKTAARCLNNRFRKLIDAHLIRIVPEVDGDELTLVCDVVENLGSFVKGFKINSEKIKEDFSNWSNKRISNIEKLKLRKRCNIDFIFMFKNLQYFACNCWGELHTKELQEKLMTFKHLKTFITTSTISLFHLPPNLEKLACYCKEVDFAPLPRSLRSLQLRDSNKPFKLDGIPPGLTDLKLDEVIQSSIITAEDWPTGLKSLTLERCPLKFDCELPSSLEYLSVYNIGGYCFDLSNLTKLTSFIVRDLSCSGYKYLPSTLTELRATFNVSIDILKTLPNLQLILVQNYQSIRVLRNDLMGLEKKE